METELQTSQIRSHGCLRGDGMNPPIHPSQFDPPIDALRTHLSGGHGRYKRPSFSPSLIDKQFSPVELGEPLPFLPPVILRRAFVATAKNGGKGQRCGRDVWILNSQRNSKNRSVERTAPPWRRFHYRPIANGSDRVDDFMDLAGIHQDRSSLGREYTQKPAGCNA